MDVIKMDTIHTAYGDFTPHTSGPGYRRKDKFPVNYHKDGVTLKSVHIEEQDVVHTSVGDIKAEFVTFHEDGSLNAVFQRYAQIGFGWSEKEEREWLTTIELDTSVGHISSKLQNIRFYKSGKVKSITFWPDEQIVVNTPIGELKVKSGLKFYESGKLATCEPASLTIINTQNGPIHCYNPFSLGIDVITNSIKFDEDGALTDAMTTMAVEVTIGAAQADVHYDTTVIIRPIRVPDPDDEDKFMTVPISLFWSSDNLYINDSIDTCSWRVDMENVQIRSIIAGTRDLGAFGDDIIDDENCEGDCSDCKLCSSGAFNPFNLV
ncbi:MAG: hypothetical protein LBN22_04975 [Clostridiales Family XIII bacterium]|jgi:antitoxin component YwqK of YwqJK toxin-antitoxin module|nr:hypothetical protein [Clostridiales Family XIII bacterium]